MAKAKAKEIKSQSVDELQDKVEKLRKELMQYRFQAKTGKLERQNVIKETRRNIARILTAINQTKKVK